jgi:uncharacterized protein (TIGR03067 family)
MSRSCQVLALAAVILSAGFVKADDQKDKKPEAALDGTWTLSSLEVNGQKVSEDALANATMTVKDGKYTFKMQDESEEGTFKVDASKKPATINLDIKTGMSKGMKQLGIYEVNAGTWKLCLNDPGEGVRPKEIHANEGSKQLLFIFKKK